MTINTAIFLQALKDKYVVMIISLITGVAVFLLFLWTVIPPLRGMAVKERDDEDPDGETVRIRVSIPRSQCP